MQCGRFAIIFIISIILSLVSYKNVVGKRFETRCKLVRELLKVGVNNDYLLGQWVCLIEKVSNRNTAAFVVSPSGKKRYGLYQIPSRWCRQGKRGGECNVSCDSLLDDDIMDDTRCAVHIFHREGFKYWPQWITRCKNNNLITDEIYRSCPDLTTPRSSPDRSLGPRLRRRYSRHINNTPYTYYDVMHLLI